MRACRGCVDLPSTWAIVGRSLGWLQARYRKQEAGSGKARPNLLARTLLRLHWRDMLLHFVWTAAEVAIRCAAAGPERQVAALGERLAIQPAVPL